MKNKSGQAMIMLVLITVIMVSIATAVTAMAMSTVLNTLRAERGSQALSIATSGVEEAILRLLRDPSYSGGSLTTESGSATMVVSGEMTKLIISTGRTGQYEREIEVQAQIVAGQLLLDSWRER